MSARTLHVSDDLTLPRDTVTSTLIVYGGKGMGKTNFGSVLAEECSASGLRWAALDPIGVWWGIRHSADGKGKGVEALILGGPHGDMPIEPTGGAVIADLVADETVNVVIDFSRKPSGEMWSIGEKIRFVTDYALRLFQRQGDTSQGSRPPLLQILDEAARYIPQTIPSGSPDLARSVGAWEQLVEEGRNVSLGVVLLTQRSARINKSVAELADMMVAFRTVGPNSIAAIIDWLGEHVEKKKINEYIEQVRKLEVGSALVVSPGWLQHEGIVKMRMRQTFDSSATDKGGARAVVKNAAKPDLDKYRERMAATIERATADDPKTLKARIRELEKQATAKGAVAKVVETKIERLEVPVLKDAAIGRFEAAAKRLHDEGDRLDRWGKAFHVVANEILGALGKAERSTGQKRTVQRLAPDIIDVPVTRRLVVPTPREASLNGLAPRQKRILDSIASLNELGIDATRDTVAAWAGSHPNSKGFGNDLSTLRTAGYLEGLTLTEAGAAHADHTARAATREELITRLALPPRQVALLEAILATHHGTTRDSLAEFLHVHPNSKGFGNDLSALRSRGLITRGSPIQPAPFFQSVSA